MVLVLAVSMLFYLHFNENTPVAKTLKKTTINDTLSGAANSIAYVNIDSLLLQYNFSKDLNDQFVKRKNMLSNQLDGKAASFEKEAVEFQEKVKRGGFLTQQSAELQQSELLKKQQSLQQLEYDLSNQLAKEQQDLNKQLYDSISNFLKVYNEDYNYNFIFSNSLGGNLLFANEKLDITTDVISQLNERYQKSKENGK